MTRWPSRCRALEEGGADAILVETQMALEEAVVGIWAARESTNLPVFATMVFDLGPRGFFTMMGVTPERGGVGAARGGRGRGGRELRQRY